MNLIAAGGKLIGGLASLGCAVIVLIIVIMVMMQSKPGGRHLTRADFGDRWPLTVEEGTVRREGPCILFETNGTTYAVNGTARTMKRWADIHEIWAPAPDGLRKDISPIMDAGEALPE